MRTFPSLVCGACTVALLACDRAAPPALPPRPGAGGWDDAATQVLSGAARALGGIERLGGVTGIVADAEVTGPHDTFRTLVVSDREGRVRMEQSTGFLAGIGYTDTWLWNDREQRTDTLDAFGIGYVRGHELHARALMPETRFTAGRLEASTDLDGTPALTIRARTGEGRETLLFYRASDTLPLGQRELWTDPVVDIRFADWDTTSGVRVFRAATFIQGEERYEYRYDKVDLGALTDSTFAVRPGPPRH